MKLNLFLALALISLFLFSCKKEELTESYLRGGNAIINTQDGNKLIAGYNINSTHNYDGYLVKLSGEGEVIWSNFYGGTGSDGFYNVVNASDGGYVAAGFQTVQSTGVANLYIVKVSDLGSVEWQYLDNTQSISQGYGIVETPDHGFLVCGYTMNDSYSDRDIYLVKVDSEGKKIWAKTYGSKNGTTLTADYDEAYAIINAADSGFYLTGSVTGNYNCCGKACLMKISSKGDSLWTKNYSEALGYSIIQTTDKNIVIGGMIYTNGQDAYMIKTDTTGNKIWEKSFGTTGYDFGTNVVEAEDGGYALTGFSSAKGSSDINVSLYKVSSDGTLSWSKTFGGSDLDQGIGIVSNTDGGFTLCGISNSGGSYIFQNRTDSQGNELWQKNLK